MNEWVDVNKKKEERRYRSEKEDEGKDCCRQRQLIKFFKKSEQLPLHGEK